MLNSVRIAKLLATEKDFFFQITRERSKGYEMGVDLFGVLYAIELSWLIPL